MKQLLEIVIIVLVLIIIFMFLKPSNENFNKTYHESVLYYDMDRLRDNKGYTLDDEILQKAMLTGGNIVSPW